MAHEPWVMVWAEPKRLRGVAGTTWVAYAIAEDGSPLGQQAGPSLEWVKLALGVGSTERHARYAEEYPRGFQVAWLADPHHNASWWRAQFWEDNRWEITFVLSSLEYVEFRDERTRRVFGHVAHLMENDAYYVVPGRDTPRKGDSFPEPAMCLRDAMRAAHRQFLVDAT